MIMEWQQKVACNFDNKQDQVIEAKEMNIANQWTKQKESY